MEKIKCLSCNNVFEADKKNEQIKVTLGNPGDVFINGDVISCPKCKNQIADTKDLKHILEKFDAVYEEGQKNFKKSSVA